MIAVKKYGLPKKERLFLKKEIDGLFARGKWERGRIVRLVYLKAEGATDDVPVKMMVSVPKKHFKRAVDRNALKRRVREAYRLNKHALIDVATLSGAAFHIAFLYSVSEAHSYQEIEKDIKQLLTRVLSKKDENKKGQP